MNIIQGLGPDRENRHKQQITLKKQNNTYKEIKANKQLGLHQQLGAMTKCTGRVSVLNFS